MKSDLINIFAGSAAAFVGLSQPQQCAALPARSYMHGQLIMSPPGGPFQFHPPLELSAGHSLSTTAAAIVPIQSFFPEPVQIIKPLYVVVQESGGEYRSAFLDANINATGDTESEAVSNLKDMVVATLELLDNTPEDQLGPGPKRQIGVLHEFLRLAR